MNATRCTAPHGRRRAAISSRAVEAVAFHIWFHCPLASASQEATFYGAQQPISEPSAGNQWKNTGKRRTSRILYIHKHTIRRGSCCLLCWSPELEDASLSDR
ncbi:hypothetical protein NDU88_002234 [Pleurodeles waltl]|uniref:Secreted protein n=1 Tax=Pleurodeles waltl TaxID=8319 RepID=A0AAV7MWS9_PLEWA|nr:hypothetical protein NDU88_002234 [Pleurodeles waltl]